jgi:hypothetical protein
VAIAITSPVGILIASLGRALPARGQFWELAGGFGFLRARAAPLLVVLFLLRAFIAPGGRPRRALLRAGGLEALGALGVLIHFLVLRVRYGPQLRPPPRVVASRSRRDPRGYQRPTFNSNSPRRLHPGPGRPSSIVMVEFFPPTAMVL